MRCRQKFTVSGLTYTVLRVSPTVPQGSLDSISEYLEPAIKRTTSSLSFPRQNHQIKSTNGNFKLLSFFKMSKIFLYAEVLTNIRQVTLYASLQTAQTTNETLLHIASDKKRVTVREGDVISGIYLPTEISGTADVTIARGKKKEISVRLEIGDTSELLPRDDVATAIEVPWSAQDLTSETTIECKKCQATIVATGKVSLWKDLPSENWAEMMDFWHCHKPHDENRNDDAAEAKGYSSRSQLAVFPGTGLVDTVSFLLHKSNCMGLMVRIAPMPIDSVPVFDLRRPSKRLPARPATRKRPSLPFQASMAMFLIQPPHIEYEYHSKVVSSSSTDRRPTPCC